MRMKLHKEHALRKEYEKEVQEVSQENEKKNHLLYKDNQGIGIIEIILILVVIIALIVIFREQISGIISKAFSSIGSGSNEILEDITVNSTTK